MQTQSNKCVVRARRNCPRQRSDWRRLIGKAFHRRGPATPNAPSQPSHTHQTGPSRFFCCCSIHLELSTCWHSTVRKHSHFQTPLENPSIQTHLVLLCCIKRLCILSSDLKALYKSVIIIIKVTWGDVTAAALCDDNILSPVHTGDIVEFNTVVFIENRLLPKLATNRQQSRLSPIRSLCRQCVRGFIYQVRSSTDTR